MIAMVTGAPGSGKSYYAVRAIAQALEKGQLVATNIELTPDWSIQCARRNPFTRLSRKRVVNRAAQYRERVYVSADLEELFRLRLRGEGEGRGLMVLDEAHNWLNARTWDADETGRSTNKQEAVTRRLKVVRFFSQHRKLGWSILLITQDEQNLDRQVRSLFEYHVRLKNLGNFKVAGIRLIPMNLFLAIWVWNDAAKSIVKRECYRLVRPVARLYDTMALSHGLEDDEHEPIYLPQIAAPLVPISPANVAGPPASSAPDMQDEAA
jgi:zona occludens toxin